MLLKWQSELLIASRDIFCMSIDAFFADSVSACGPWKVELRIILLVTI
jgi:hypothetical protein